MGLMEEKSEQVKDVIPAFIILEPISIINGSFSLKGKEIEVVPARLRVFFSLVLLCLCISVGQKSELCSIHITYWN